MSGPAAAPDLIAFLQTLPEGRTRRGVRYPQWLLLLMVILGIFNGCPCGILCSGVRVQGS
ncbi:hypothetical protein NZK33_20065 [Cyanobium sp. FGCU-6]|nr:hypothetical protein [Cyanobium sp. FGCU6]